MMRRAAGALVTLAALPLMAQTSGQTYRDLFTAWRAADPTLEKNAAQEPDRVAQRATAAGQAAAKYTQARQAYLKGLIDESADLMLWLQDSSAVVELDLAPASDMQALVTTATNSVSKDIKTYAKETDPGFVALRLALERERAALGALSDAVKSREAAGNRILETLASTEAARASALGQYQGLLNQWKDAIAQSTREDEAWTAYYQALASAPRSFTSAPATDPAKPEGPTPVVIGGVRINNPAKAAVAPGTPVETARVVPPAPRPANPPAPEGSGPRPPVPMVRYTGDWIFPESGGLSFGDQPETVDLSVREEDGKLTGTLTAKFKLPATSPDDPNLSFKLSGDVSSSRIQKLETETEDGAKGTIELIPGSAFNLLEINFQMESRPGKIHAANFVLVKK